MTDSTIDTNSSEGALDVSGSMDDLFRAADDDAAQWGSSDDESTEGAKTAATESMSTDDSVESTAGIEDQTAADVFGQLQASTTDSSDVDDVLEDESPDDIIASADEPDPEPDVDDDLLLDEGALEELLLTGRTKEKEFLWIEADEDESTAETATDAEEPSPEAEELAMIDPADVFADDEAPAESDAAAAGDHVPEPTETALDTDDETTTPATMADEESSSGIIDRLRSKLGGLF